MMMTDKAQGQVRAGEVGVSIADGGGAYIK